MALSGGYTVDYCNSPEFVDDLDAECVKKRGTHDSWASVGEVTVYCDGKTEEGAGLADVESEM